ncbi:MAG: hypothetical protein EXQ82_12380 [Pseudolabrys sp.]|nr:hypothetical protein [Pseudolabrys sp.]
MANIDGALKGLLKLTIAAAVIGAGALVVLTVLDHLTLDRRAAERRALLQRNAELNIGAIAPGSALACLDGVAGEAVENACERRVFNDPHSAAAAVAYTAARLALLADVHAFAQIGDASLIDAFAATRRAIELDRYGIAAHVLAVRDGCTAAQCAAFGLLRDSATLKANLMAQAFDTYVARYASAWNRPESEKQVPVASAPAPAPVASAPQPPPSGQPVSNKYDFPSAASIPPVSIMNAEPPLPKEPAPNAAAPSATEDSAPAAKLPVPPKRPQTQAATPPAR